ncbi:serine/threonine-protein kinase SMG1-like [Saccoglossus kowalevskii]
MSERLSSSRPRRPRRDRASKEPTEAKIEGKRDKTSTGSVVFQPSQQHGRPRRVRRERERKPSLPGDKHNSPRDATTDKKEHRRGSNDKSDHSSTAELLLGKSLIQYGSRGFSRDVNTTRDMRQNHERSLLFNDDSQLSSLVRRITREEDRDRRLVAVRQLREYLYQAENNKTILKVADSLLIALQDVFYERALSDLKKEIAACIGIIGSIFSYDAQRYFQWLFGKLSNASADETKGLYLTSLAQSLTEDREILGFASAIPYVMTHLQTLLENVDTPDLLIATVDNICYVAEVYPSIFRQHFRDTVDILVGWHIDTSQKTSLTRYTAETLISFHDYWITDLAFSTTLLAQFLEDMEAYAEDLSQDGHITREDEEEIPSTEVCESKITALISVFATVVTALGDSFSPVNTATISHTYITKVLQRIIKCVQVSSQKQVFEDIFIAANVCLEAICHCLHSHLAKCFDGVLKYALDQVDGKWQLTKPHAESLLCLLFKIVDNVNTNLPSSFIEHFLGPNSVYLQLRFLADEEILGLLMSIYHSLLGMKNIPLLESSYNLVLSDLEIAYRRLLENSGSSVQCKLVDGENPFKDSHFNVENAEAAVVFDVCALSEIGSSKNTIIGMWAISPSIFELFTKHLSVCSWKLAIYYPSVQYAIMQALYAHCFRHGHFISSSVGSNQPAIIEGTVLSSVTPTTSTYFPTILTILVNILSHTTSPQDIKILGLTWLQNIIEKVVPCDREIVYACPEFQSSISTLLDLATSPDIIISLRCCKCLELTVTSNHLSHQLLKRLVDVCKVKMTCTNTKVSAAYTAMLKTLPTDLLTRCGDLSLIGNKQQSSSSSPNPSGIDIIQAMRLACRSHMSKSPTGSFHSHSFRSIMGFVLKGVAPGQLEGNPWLERLYYSCQRHDKQNGDGRKKDDSMFTEMVVGNDPLSWFWATCESALFCVLSKLRTPLGKPQETFQNIESTLRAFAAETKLEDPKSPPVVLTTKDNTVSYYKTQLRPVLLLQFLEHLEKHMYNAYEGCVVALPTLPKVVKTFFRTNRATCQEWLTRIRLSAMTVAIHCGQPAVAVRHAFQLLQDMKNNNNTSGTEFEHAILIVVQAMCQLHSPEAIQGIQVWCKDIVGRNLPWIGAVAHQAAGRYEAAAGEYISGLQKYLGLESIPNYPVNSSMNRSSMKKFGTSTPPNSPKVKKLSTEVTNGNSVTPKKTLLHKTPDPDPLATEFIINQVVDCYVELCQWSEVEKWQDSVQRMRSENVNMNIQKAFTIHTDMNYIKALLSFEEHQFSSVADHLELIPGGSLDNLDDSSLSDVSENLSWDPRELQRHGDLQIMRTITHFQKLFESDDDNNLEMFSFSSVLEKTSKISDTCLRVCSMEWPCNLSPSHVIISQTINAFVNNENGKESFLPAVSKNLQLDPDHHDVGIYNRLLRLSKYLHYFHKRLTDSPIQTALDAEMFALQMASCRLARKQGNIQLAQDLLMDKFSQLNGNEETDIEFGVEGEDAGNSTNPMLTALSTVFKKGIIDVQVQKLERETAKLLNSMGSISESQEVLSTCVVRHSSLLYSGVGELCLGKGELNAKSLLSLFKWIQGDWKSSSVHLKLPKGSDLVEKSKLTENLVSLMDMEHHGCQLGLGVSVETSSGLESVGSSPAIGEVDAVCGRLLHLSTMQAPDLAKAWSALANWCYKWGRKAVDIASSDGGVKLSEEEKSNVLAVLPVGLTNDETDSILSVLSQAHCSASGIQDEDITEQVQSAYDDGTETTRKQLLNVCPALQTADLKVVDVLLDIWKGVCRRIFSHYELAAKSYFTYLKLRGQDTGINASGISQSESNGDNITLSSHEDANTTATLRLLRLLVKHAGELRDVLENGLANTPTGPWKGIIPQLFSRLNHPEAYVRQSISDLLCRVGQDSPHLIIYPAVIGCAPVITDKRDNSKEGMLNKILLVSPSKQEEEDEIEETEKELEDDENDGDDDEDDNDNRTMLQNAFGYILDNLGKFNPMLVSQVQVLVQELRRITLLWEELWLGTLNQHHIDVSLRRVPQLEDEIKRVLSNNTLTKEEKMAIIREKHNAILKPTVYALEQVQAITSQPADTPNEKWFQDNYTETINKSMESLKNPSHPANPLGSWNKFKQLHHSLQQRASKRATHLLQMDEISPRLAQMKSTVISMPGLTAQTHQVVTIESFSTSVTILPTKTKPKKLVFIGSDGQKYTYLFKGLEDLHLDERIMQFLTIVNNMFARANKRLEVAQYHARHYSVTPLGPRSGLIQWVDGATPLFGLYKRWQQREAAAAAMKAQGSSNTAVQPAPILRPSEVYYSKMTPALKEKGITDLSSRKEWPLSVMRQVLQDIMEETPSDLLSRELWCSCSGASEWWQISQSYARSTAVMSMIGYIIGLGDRHLDNVMVDLLTGEVVHIDYNVCFEKGRNLRVPEKVPFRMTPNIQTALGVTGVEGVFRLSCEQVLKTMRKGRETLLTLLEAFVYDPLVDWTTGNEAGFASAFYGGGQLNPAITEGRQSKEQMEREITRSLFSSRVAEMKKMWFKNRDDIVSSLTKLQESLKIYTKTQNDCKDIAKLGNELNVQRTTLDAALKDKQHSIHTLHKRYGDHSKVVAAQTSIQQSIQEKLNECDLWNSQHVKALDAVRGSHIASMCTEIAKSLDFGVASYVHATEFLQNAGQAQTVIQCEQVESELSNLIHQRQQMLRGCLEVLHSYSTIASQFPSSYVNQNRCYDWQNWLQELVCNFTSEMCKSVFAMFEEKYGSGNKPDKIKRVFATELKLQKILSDDNIALMKVIERRAQDNTETSILTAGVKETAASVKKFVKENGVSGVTSLTSVTVTALCALNRRALMMEGAASGAGDRLMDLTSRDGSWFLEELCSMSGNVSHLVGLLQEHPLIPMSEDVQHIINTVKYANKVYIALQELNTNFRSIILPEAVKTIQCEEATVLTCISALEDICVDYGLPLEGILQQLELNLQNLTLGMDVNYAICEVINLLRDKFQHIIMPMSSTKTEVSTADMTAGQMLLSGFNGLFTQLDSIFYELLDSFNQLNIATQWNKVDVIREARSLQCYIFTDATRQILTDIFFIKRLQAIQDFFTLCKQYTMSFKDDCNHTYSMHNGCNTIMMNGQSTSIHSLSAGSVQDMTVNMYRDGDLSKPIKRFIADFVRGQLTGLPSQALGYTICLYIEGLGLDVVAEVNSKDIGVDCKVSIEEMCKKSVDTCIQKSIFSPGHLSQASALTSSHDTSWKKQDLARRLDIKIATMQSSVQRAQLQLARYQWLYEDVLLQSGHHTSPIITPTRSSVMSDLRKRVQRLTSLETTLTGVIEKYTALESSVSQRLKWAAGANPSLNPVMQNIEEAAEKRNNFLTMNGKRSSDVTSLCNAILHFEALRTRTQEAINADTNFIALLRRCEESCNLAESCNSTVSKIEQSFIKLKPPRDDTPIDETWMKALLEVIQKEAKNKKYLLKQKEAHCRHKKDALKTQFSTVKGIITTHHKLISEVKHMLKSMAREEEALTPNDNVSIGQVKRFTTRYKLFSEAFANMLKKVQESLKSHKDKENAVDDNKENHDKNSISTSTNVNRAISPSRPPLLQQKAAESATPPTSKSATVATQAKASLSVMRDPRTGKAIQMRNSYAVSVWRKVKAKLEEKSPGTSNNILFLSPLQVDFVIRDATNFDNLAQLYEGWTAWV